MAAKIRAATASIFVGLVLAASATRPREFRVYEFCREFFHPFDLDCDHEVTVADTEIVSDHWRHDLADGHHDDVDAEMDFSGDGDIDVQDVQMLNIHLGEWGPRILSLRLQSFMEEDTNTGWGFKYGLSGGAITSRRIFKIDQRDVKWYDEYSTVHGDFLPTSSKLVNDPSNPNQPHPDCVGNAFKTNSNCLAYYSYKNPTLWWLLGEEVNSRQWDCENTGSDKDLDGDGINDTVGQCVDYNKDGYCDKENNQALVCVHGAWDARYPKASVFARWLHDIWSEIERGQRASDADPGRYGKMVAFYFVQNDGPYKEELTADYLDDFYTEWSGREWGDVPFDGVHYHYFPPAGTQESSLSAISVTTSYIENRYQEHLARSWLPNQIWFETLRGRAMDPTLSDRCATAQRMVNLLNWVKTKSWITGFNWWPSWDSYYEESIYCIWQDDNGNSICDDSGTKLSGPQQGFLSPIGKAFRDGSIPAECQ